MFDPLSHTGAENPFYLASTAPNSALDHPSFVVFGKV